MKNALSEEGLGKRTNKLYLLEKISCFVVLLMHFSEATWTNQLDAANLKASL
jgi:surface polysaccharide O-acyltransferase-like enzyme